eukprot:TRINITY_DN33038_c0_g1_i1.p1 TRINITY_DN33038_c0_g1~~TRINITY_DN33038_c0_g1_i1.p1  ORF type:complete len:587 (+),score=164.23 TRINITY_DN33038_c0_g1_i1:221-1981(+)
MAGLLRLAGLVALVQILNLASVTHAEKIVFYESFEETVIGDKWVVSTAEQYGGEWQQSAPEDTGDQGLMATQKAKKYGIAASLPEPVDPKVDTLVLQYDLRLTNGIECGGAYLKFLMPQTAGWTPDQLVDSSPYSIMFGPDKCGATNKVHFIFRHKHPVTGEFIEHHLKSPPFPTNDKLSHVYTAVVYPNNTLKIMIDGEVKKTANLLSSVDFDPPVIPAKTIKDPEDKKPADWVDIAKIPDASATKPDDWDESEPLMIDDEAATKPDGWLDDEPLEVDDPEAAKPDDWDEEEDGEWEPPTMPNPRCDEAPGCGEWTRPQIKNPKYKGKWMAPLIDNPEYKGVWAARDIPNPDFFDLERPNLEPVAAVGIEIWTMSDGFVFDNILVTDDEAAAAEYRATTWKPKFEKESALEKERRAAEEKKAGAAKPNQGYFDKVKETFFDNLHKIVELPALSSVKKQLITGLEFLESKDEYGYAAIVVVLFSLVLVIYALLPGKKKKAKKVTVEQAKKEDITSPDDEVAESTPAEVEKKEEDDTPARSSKSGAVAAAEKEIEEVTQEVAEEAASAEIESSEGKATSRRRNRRET